MGRRRSPNPSLTVFDSSCPRVSILDLRFWILDCVRGGMAQLGAQHPCKMTVRGSIPRPSTDFGDWRSGSADASGASGRWFKSTISDGVVYGDRSRGVQAAVCGTAYEGSSPSGRPNCGRAGYKNVPVWVAFRQPSSRTKKPISVV